MNAPISEVLECKGSDVYAVTPNTTVAEAVRQMNSREIGAVVVIEHGELIGIFTERDVLTRIVAGERNPSTTLVSEVMTPKPVTISPDITISEVLSEHSGRHYRHLPVVAAGRIVGMISCRDVLRWMADDSTERAEKLEEYIESGGCVS